MKAANVSIFIGVIVVGLISGRAPLHAQSTSATLVVEDDDKPWSQGVPIESRKAARELFLEGNKLFSVPLFARAAEKYLAALGQWRHPAFYFNLALAQLNLGQEVEARGNFEHALQHGEEPLGAERFQKAQEQLQELNGQLGQIHVTCQTPGAEVTLDGVSLFTGPGSYQGWVTAKAHEVTAKRPDYLSEARRVKVSSGELKSLDLKLITLSEAAESGRRWAKWKPWVVVTAGGVVAASAVALNALSVNNFHAYDNKFEQLDCAKKQGCVEGDTSTEDLSVQLNHARLEQKIAVGGYIIGGSLVAVGTVLLYLNRPRLLEQPAVSSFAGNVVITPVISTEMFGLLVTASH